MRLWAWQLLLAVLALSCATAAMAQAGTAMAQNSLEELTAEDIVRAAVDQWRGQSSISEMTMTIHRPDWERSMSMIGWTAGSEQSLVRVTEPAKDAGNATLTKDNNMWSFSPKINRVIKVPSSMMSQSWMGSDFSNKDISRSDEIVKEYQHRLIGSQEVSSEEGDSHIIYTIESVPHEDAAVVWGRQVLVIRDDWVLIREDFYDQDDALVKSLVTLEIGEFGGRAIASHQRMEKTDDSGEWTEVIVNSAEFDVDLNDNLFTLANLRNPRESRN